MNPNLQVDLIRFGADYLLVILLALCGIMVTFNIVRHRRYDLIPIIIMAGLTSLLIGKLLSLAYQPDEVRPFVKLGVSAGASYINNPGFPSDHALLGTAAYLATVYVTRSRRLVFGLGVVLVIMCVARVLALVHTPLDIIGGLIAGASGGLWYLQYPRARR